MKYIGCRSMNRPLCLILSIVLIIGCREDFHYDFADTMDPEPIDGISAGYVNLNNPSFGVSIDHYSEEGEVILTFSTQAPEIRKGSIITVDLDTMGYLRRVIAVTSEDNKITLQTEQAYLNDLFVDKEFTLNTKLIPPGEVVDSKGPDEDISKSLTDVNGHIHPFEIIYYDKDNKIRKRGASDLITKSKVEDYNIIDFYESFSAKDLYGKADDNIHFYIDEGHASLVSDAVFEFDFEYDGELDEDTKVKKGDLKSFSFYLDSKAEFMTKVALDMSRNAEENDKKELIGFKKVTAKFFVGTVPVWVSVDCDIWAAYEFNSTARLNADWGFESIQTLRVGGVYNGQTEIFTPIKNYTHQDNIYPLNISGEIDLYARLELFPRVEVLFYSFFGPYAEIVPFVEGNYSSALQSQITLGGSETFIAWDSNLDVGLDFRVGSKLTFLGLFNREFGPVNINCFDLTLWNAPKSLQLLTNLPEQVQVNTTLTLNLTVRDNLGNHVILCPVYIFGDGSFSRNILLSDSHGDISVNWLINNAGINKFSARVFNAEGDVLYELNEQVIALPDTPTGKIIGIVRDASTSYPLSGVRADVYQFNNLIASGESLTDGSYEINVPENTNYLVIFSKGGYLNADYHNVNVNNNINTVLEPVLQIDNVYSGNGNVSGIIKNALDGTGIEGVSLRLLSGINVTSGSTISSTTTSSMGGYIFNDIPAGNYTIEASKPNFNTGYFNVICLGGRTVSNQDAPLSPILNSNETRIVLTWGLTPDDLDSHFTGPLDNGTRFHMYYVYSNEGGYGSPWPEIVTLDLDDIHSFGPETTTLYQQRGGVYRFSVHDFSNRNSSYSTALSNSGAQVKVYQNSGLVATFNVAPNIEGTLWTVFEMNNNIITPLNQLSYESDEDNISKGNYVNPDLELFRNLPKK